MMQRNCSWKCLALFLAVCVCLTSAQTVYTVPLPQTEFLHLCYQSWGASNAGSSQFQNWNFTKDGSDKYAVSPCAGPSSNTSTGAWDYVTCEYGTSTARIIGLEYTIDSGPFVLSGTIPGKLGAMTALETLSLSNQKLTGVIPSVSSLTNLRSLDLGYNSLTGDIPDFKGIKDSIQTISAGSNYLNGTLESGEIGSLTELRYFDLSNNIMFGKLPETLLQTMTSLSYLDLSLNSFSGSIPAEFFDNGEFTELNHLALSKNFLTGSIPNVGKLVELQHLHLDTNKFTGTIPKSVFGMTKLLMLMLGHNKLHGTLSDKIGDLTNLMSLHLGSSGLHGALPSKLSMLQDSLQYIDIADNRFTGAFPSEKLLGERSSLISVEFGKNDWTPGPLPEGILHETMEHFDVAFSNLVGTIPQQVHNMKNLQTLRMQSNAMTGTIPYQMEDLLSLRFIDLANNQLTGVVDLCDLVLRSGSLDALVVTGNELNCYAECWVSESNKIIYNSDTSGDSDASTLDFCQKCPAGTYSTQYYHNISDPLAGEGYYCEKCAEGKYSLEEHADDPSVCRDCPISNNIFYSQVAGPACFPVIKGQENQYVGGEYYEVGSFLFAIMVGLIMGLVFGVLLNMKRSESERVHPLATFIVAMKTSLSGFATLAELFVAMAFTVAPPFFMYGFAVILLRIAHIFIGGYIVMKTYKITNGRKFSQRTQYEDLVDQKNLLNEENQSVYMILAVCCVLELQFVQLLPWINTDYAQSHQGWPDVMTYYGITFFKVFQSGIVSVIFMLFITFTDDSIRGDSMLAMISLYILFSSVLVLYNVVVELAIINSCFKNQQGTDDIDMDEPILEGKEGANSRNTVFVDFGTGYRESIGMGGLGLNGTDNPMARKSIGFKDIDLVSNPIARGSIFDPLGGNNPFVNNSSEQDDGGEDDDSRPVMGSGKIVKPKKVASKKKKHHEDPVPNPEPPADVPDIPGSVPPAAPRGPPPPGGPPPSSGAIPSMGMPPPAPRGIPPRGPPPMGGPKKYTPPPRP